MERAIEESLFIRAEKLAIRYGSGTWGVRDVNMELRGGDFTALIGANGAGKTSLIHALCGVLRPTEGTVRRSSIEPTEIGWCSQHQVIDWFMSVRDNVMLGARLAGIDRKRSADLTDEALRLVGLEDISAKNPDQLSGGQQQRVMIARALVHLPRLLLLDEPTVGLDPEASQGLLMELRRRADDGAAVLVSSHDLGLVENYCDQVMVMESGTIIAQEEREAFLKRFAGDEVLVLEYEGDLPEAVLSRLVEQGVEIVNERPLELLVSRGSSVGEFVLLLESNVRLVDINRRIPGMREAYMKLASRKANDVL